MNSNSFVEIHYLISERVVRIVVVKKTETFIEMRKTTREIPIPPKDDEEEE
jgi:Lrp/AsnC family transcriptional regulator for asnA, asnC and gidA